MYILLTISSIHLQLLLFSQGTEGALDIEPEHYLTGEKFGSWFGCDFAVLDLNNDGLQDIVVGAPFYNDERVGGAVYVYLNSPQVREKLLISGV